MLDSNETIRAVLADHDVAELWSISWRYVGKLKRNEIRMAAQFVTLPNDWFSKHMTVDGLRLAHELRGLFL